MLDSIGREAPKEEQLKALLSFVETFIFDKGYY